MKCYLKIKYVSVFLVKLNPGGYNETYSGKITIICGSNDGSNYFIGTSWFLCRYWCCRNKLHHARG